jgi:hypothetical protein
MHCDCKGGAVPKTISTRELEGVVIEITLLYIIPTL